MALELGVRTRKVSVGASGFRAGPQHPSYRSKGRGGVDQGLRTLGWRSEFPASQTQRACSVTGLFIPSSTFPASWPIPFWPVLTRPCSPPATPPRLAEAGSGTARTQPGTREARRGPPRGPLQEGCPGRARRWRGGTGLCARPHSPRPSATAGTLSTPGAVLVPRLPAARPPGSPARFHPDPSSLAPRDRSA